jgi:hypothetical protein
VTAGERAPTVGALIDMLANLAQRLTGRPIAPPRLVSRAVFERLMRSLPALGRTRLARRIAAQALDLCMYCIDQPLPSSLPELELRHGSQTLPPLETIVQRNLDYWATGTAYSGGRSGAPGDAVPAMDDRLTARDRMVEIGGRRCIA